jgi:Glycosyl transferase family 2
MPKTEPAYPRMTFGLIVLNGEPFTRYCLRALYPFAHEIIVVEGACQSAARLATADGHSTDGTLATIERFKAEEDPQGKVQLVRRDGFWSEKDEQSQAYAERASGDYLWQVDIDEFYHPADMRSVVEMLHADPEITAVTFEQITFWGGFDYVADGWYLRRGAKFFHRLFKWGSGYQYVTHRPPTVTDPGGRDLRGLKWVDGKQLSRRGVFLYHYALLLPKQVIEKSTYYDQAAWVDRAGYGLWAQNNFLRLGNPFRVHNVYDHPSWLERFRGTHPPQVTAMRRDMAAGRIPMDMRALEDVEQLLRSPRYRVGRAVLKLLDYPDRCRASLRRRIGSLLRLVR